MGKQIVKIAGRMIVYILIIVALVFIFYPETPKEKTNAPVHKTDANQVLSIKN